MSIVEFSRLLYAKVTLHHALAAGRYMITCVTKQDQQGNPRPRDQVIHEVSCADVIAAGVQWPALIFNLSVSMAHVRIPGRGPEQTVAVTVNVRKRPLMPFCPLFSAEAESPSSWAPLGKTNRFRRRRHICFIRVHPILKSNKGQSRRV